MNFSRPTIVTCAVTGNLAQPSQSPYLPVTPAQIAQSCIEAAEAGAAIVHIHVRDPETGAPSMDTKLYRKVVDRIKDSGVDVIINLTTGPGQRFVPGKEDPAVAGKGTSLMRGEARVVHVEELRPEICTLDLNTMYSFGSVVINTPDSLRVMAARIRAAGTAPELEIFGPGDVILARDLAAEGVLPKKNFLQFVLGVKYAAPASPEMLSVLASMLPDGWEWSAFGVGRMAFPAVAMSVLRGGHVRVGMEDNLQIEKGRLARSNAELVAKAVRILSDLGSRPATPTEARDILSLKAYKN
ncbi:MULTISPECIES: 3-keto-5-aminohexanoate cleavage protein [unclassified Bradyrhizobium]|uniref:3-keto-5-aminohexanoate cleavage protein n=1 Tax=unclassified Bradyrhizobium TaxID=2631580 RepID=UPI00247AAE01|nr:MULTISPECIES: 3-keto-5-aminohexanoate cleavage protein [unclassified Bradyrhizobium]WGR73837.1 3-keto-5-aminohexanoate cleavage protein [Bradyrhizobium sp. ISRA426]WGR78674.1 3-keto-5-aminohexanoate cleavage protein [Bradyrhizobium sp. ISRA430]WGR89076.1 3-keto-5-aminohexanoate cleavage protein [Bradyrhizobium sp. ISRA432]